MNIAIDISPLKTGHYLQHRVRGTGFYLKNLQASLSRYYPENNYIYFSRGELFDKTIDLIHYPYFEPFFLTLPLFYKSRSIITVHDLTPLVFPKNFETGLKGKLKWEIQKNSLKNANAIITDSISSKKDVIKFTGIEESKISVVYLAASNNFKVIKNANVKKENLRKKYNLPEKFVLYVGDVTWNKNLPRLIEAVKNKNIPIVLVGDALVNKDADLQNPWNSDLAKTIKLCEGDNKIFRLGFVPNDELVILYNSATLFAMPSLYEGFGLPILEAMSCGCPVVTSKEGSINEISDDACEYVDAYSVENISEGISRVFNNINLQKELSKKGLNQAKKFNWEKTAMETMRVYKNVIDNIKK